MKRTATIKRQPADARLRTMEAWRCNDGHDFSFDPDRCSDTPKRCPHVVGQASNGRWQGCQAELRRIRQAGVLR